MPTLIEHLAELTGLRDRDQLDACVVRAVHAAVEPLEVALYRPTGAPGKQRWRNAARIGREGRIVVADPPWTDPRSLPKLDALPLRAACWREGRQTADGDAPQTVCFPIATALEVVGVLELSTALALAPSDRAAVATVAQLYGNFHGLLDHSERDPLTGLLNRQTFTSALVASHPPSADLPAPVRDGRSNRRQPKNDRSAWLGVVDIDHFKRVNDNFGHPIGDEVLLLLSRLMRSTFREIDRLYRIGGEEFVVVLDCASAEQASRAFERLRSNVERFGFPQVGRITVSIGVTQVRVGDNPSGAFARADQALYHVKHAGRNDVAAFEALVASGQIVATEVVGDVELF